MRWLTLLLALLVPRIAGATEPDVEVFVRPGCPHCADAHEYLSELRAKRPGLVVVERDIASDPAAAAELDRAVRAAGRSAVGVPTFRVGGELVVGFRSAETTGRTIEALLDSQPGRAPDSGGTCALDEPCEEPAKDVVDLPLLGAVDVSRWGLPLFTIAIGLVDGFNPCAMWVLLFLLAMLVNLKDRRRIALIAGTFVVVSGLAYYAFMAAWLNVFVLAGFSRGIQLALGLFAVAVGAVHMKDFFIPHAGPSLSIPASVKPTIYARVRAVLAAKNLPIALVSATVLAILVNVVELLCTAGLPAIYTQILVQQEIPPAGRYAYLALYNLAYMLDDGIMVGVAVVTLGKHKLQEKGGRVLKLVSGTTLAILGVLLVVAPQLLVW